MTGHLQEPDQPITSQVQSPRDMEQPDDEPLIGIEVKAMQCLLNLGADAHRVLARRELEQGVNLEARTTAERVALISSGGRGISPRPWAARRPDSMRRLRSLRSGPP
jgi:hypothetical protein